MASTGLQIGSRSGPSFGDPMLHESCLAIAGTLVREELKKRQQDAQDMHAAANDARRPSAVTSKKWHPVRGNSSR